jgi:hypothetical protein
VSNKVPASSVDPCEKYEICLRTSKIISLFLVSEDLNSTREDVYLVFPS